MTGDLVSRPFSWADVGRLGVGPVLYAAGIVLWWVSDRLGVVGPFDKAQFGWVVVVPVLALAPAVAGLAEATPHLADWSRRLAIAIAAITGLSVGAWIATNSSQVGCRPVTTPLDLLPQALATGLVAGLAFFGGYVVSAAQASSGHQLAGVVAGSVTWLVIAAADFLLMFLVLFPPLACAIPQGI